MTQAPFEFAPFGDLAVVGAAHDVLLQRVCYCYHTADPQTTREAYGMSQIVAILESSRPVPSGCTRWWRIKKDGRATYVCVDPASPGYRDEAPKGPGVYLEDLPSEIGLKILPNIAKTTLSARAKVRPPDDTSVLNILESVKCASTRHETRDTSGFIARMERHSVAIQRGTYPAGEMAMKSIGQLYENGLFETEVDCARFSASICLFELQAEMNGWIEQRAYLNPQDFLRTYIEGGHASEKALESVGKRHFEAGRTVIKASLENGCFWSFQNQVYLALHHFWIAHMIATVFKGRLSYTRMVAEESLVCANTGLACGLSLFFDRSFIKIGKDLAASIVRGDERPEAKFLHSHCSVFFPVIPRPLAHMIIAFARILARPKSGGGESDLEPIIAADKAAGITHPTSAVFLSFVRDYLLLNAAKHLRLEATAQRFAVSVMGRLMVDRALL